MILELEIVRQTESALGVYAPKNKRFFFVAKSQITVGEKVSEKLYRIDIPEWILERQNLLPKGGL